MKEKLDLKSLTRDEITSAYSLVDTARITDRENPDYGKSRIDTPLAADITMRAAEMSNRPHAAFSRGTKKTSGSHDFGPYEPIKNRGQTPERDHYAAQQNPNLKYAHEEIRKKRLELSKQEYDDMQFARALDEYDARQRSKEHGLQPVGSLTELGARALRSLGITEASSKLEDAAYKQWFSNEYFDYPIMPRHQSHIIDKDSKTI